MSGISDIFSSYDEALSQSRDRYTSLYAERVENGHEFYKQFFHKLIVPFRPKFSDTAARSYIKSQIERFFGTSEIDFVAIDGTCSKDAFSDFMVFYGGAYGARGRVSLEGDPPKVRYERWEINRDVSMAAWVPIPFAEYADISGAEETFLSSDEDRVNLAGIHTSLMQLAEIYLAYNVATSSTIGLPRLIMLDMSLSSLMAASSHGAHTGLVGYSFDRRALDHHDVTIALAHPFNPPLGVPSTKRFGLHNAVIAEFHKRNTSRLTLADITAGLGISSADLSAANVKEFLTKARKDGRPPLCTWNASTRELTTVVNCRESWSFTVSLFQDICTRLFIKKDQSALTYEVTDPEDGSRKRRRWMSPDDISFLLAVGLRALVEACWDKRIMLVGVVKDSESRYLTRNYLGVMRHLKRYKDLDSLRVGLLPWTDRIYLETIPTYCDDELEAPWSSVEFDSTFMTLRLGTGTSGQPEIMGVRVQGGEIVAPERLFVRCLGQFFLSRQKRTPLMGHVVFLDRLAFPLWDKQSFDDNGIQTSGLGRMSPIIYPDRDADNVGQLIMIYLLNTLTRNHFPEVIGYPTPLHKADWGAKSVGRRIRGMIESSEIPFRAKPIAKTLRAIRDAHRRP